MYSKISIVNSLGVPEILTNVYDGTKTLVSAVYFEDEENIVVGSEAAMCATIDSEHAVPFAKKKLKEVAVPSFSVYGNNYTYTEVCALIFKRLKDISELNGNEIEDIVLCCPYCFDIEERSRLKKAAELAGFNVLSLIGEAVAVGMNYI